MSGIRSMTGYGQATAQRRGVRLDVTVRGLNARYLDLVMRLPAEYQFLEADLRRLVSSQIGRGRVEVTVNRVVVAAHEPMAIRVDRRLFGKLLQIYSSYCGAAMAEPGVLGGCVRDILGRSEVLSVRSPMVEPRAEAAQAQRAMKAALVQFKAATVAEGARLSADMQRRFRIVRRAAQRLSKLAQSQGQVIQARFSERSRQIEGQLAVELGPLSAERRAAEVLALIDRADVTEELVRMSAHLDACAEIFAAPTEGEVGKRLEFLLQELQREFTTTAAKSQLVTMQHAVVDAKAELEKIREQIQNVV